MEWLVKNKKFFYHFTDIRNLPLIEAHGLLSMEQLRSRGISPITGGNATSLSIDAAKGYDKYVHLCFRGNHPMEFAAKREGRVIQTKFLRICPTVLYHSGTLVSDMIVTANDATMGAPSEMINKLDLPVIYNRMDWKNPEVKIRLDKAEKYEILIPNTIEKRYISGF